MNPHLTETQLFNLLADAPRAEIEAQPLQQQAGFFGTQAERAAAEQHLQACSRCRMEFTLIRDGLANFHLAADGFAQASPMLLPRIQRSSLGPWFTVPRAVWALGLAAAMALCTASVAHLHQPGARGPIQPVMSTSASTSPAPNTLSDNALLEGIDNDLSTSVPPSLEPLDTPAAGDATSTSSQN